ncbi:MAG: integrase arm-type DNA-binding domain-containing protein [Burkholderiaceae bacterium]|nr:integrase arm-type DNA-binding domain-containing protein [Burkholderiaceae bacterium]
MALTDTFVRFAKASKPTGDKHYDGGGLYIYVKPQGRYWRLDYRYLNKRKTLALGTYPEVSLAKARKRRDDARVLLADGVDPGEAKRQERQEKLLAASHTFESVALKWMEKQAKVRSASTQDKVMAWLQHDVFPRLGKRPISAIKPRDVLAVVQKVEDREAYDSAHRIKQMCGQIFRFGVALDLVQRDVTVDLRGALAVIPRAHHAALTEPKDVAVLMRAIHGYDGYPVAKAALKLAPLVFVRPGELRAAEWSEIDLDAAEWRIPAAKMKMKVEHIVPLSRQAVSILNKLYPATGDGRFVFPSLRTPNECMSENTVNAALRGLGYSKEQMTGHGFRAMARTIMDEVLGERIDLIEHQLAHAVKDPNGRAYNRTKHLQARREMMQRWADYLDRLRESGHAAPQLGRDD